MSKRPKKDSVVDSADFNGGTRKVGNPGNKGGKGAVPSVVRAACTGHFADALPKLKEIVDWCFAEFKKIKDRSAKEGHTWLTVQVPDDSYAETVKALDVLDLKYSPSLCQLTDVPPIILKEARGCVEAFGKYGLGQKITYELESPEWIEFAWESAKDTGHPNQTLFTKHLREKMGVPELN